MGDPGSPDRDHGDTADNQTQQPDIPPDPTPLRTVANSTNSLILTL